MIENDGLVRSIFKELDLLLSIASLIKDESAINGMKPEVKHVDFIVGNALRWGALVTELYTVIKSSGDPDSRRVQIQDCSHRMGIISRDTQAYCNSIAEFVSPSLRMAIISTQRASSYCKDLARSVSLHSEDNNLTGRETMFFNCIYKSIVDARKYVLSSDIGQILQKYQA